MDRVFTAQIEFKMVRLAGFEPATYGLEVRCSIRAELQAHMN